MKYQVSGMKKWAMPKAFPAGLDTSYLIPDTPERNEGCS
jgi:hypothetical protein